MNPNIVRALMSNALIPPPVEVGQVLPGMTFTDGNTPNGLRSDITYVMPVRTEKANYRYYWAMTASQDYNFVYPIPRVFKNGELLYTGYVGSYPGLGWSPNSYFYGNTGTKAGSFNFTAKSGDEIRIQYHVGTRLGDPGNHTYIHHNVTRIA